MVRVSAMGMGMEVMRVVRATAIINQEDPRRDKSPAKNQYTVESCSLQRRSGPHHHRERGLVSGSPVSVIGLGASTALFRLVVFASDSGIRRCPLIVRPLLFWTSSGSETYMSPSPSSTPSSSFVLRLCGLLSSISYPTSASVSSSALLV